MEKNKKNLFLGIILVILVIIAYGYYFEQNQSEGKQNNFLSGVNPKEISKIEVNTLGSSTALLKQEERWKIDGEEGFYVSSEVASDMEQSLANLVKADFELASENSEKKEIYHTDEKHGAEVKLYRGEEMVADFIVGRLDSPTVSHTYISRPEREKTYLARNVQLTGIFLREDWRSKAIFDNPEKEVKKLRFQYPEKEFSLTRKETEEGDKVWRSTEPNSFTADSKKVSEITDLMIDLTATQIPEQKFEGTGLEKHLIIVEAQGGEWSNTIMVGEKYEADGEKDFYYAKKGSSDNIYLITKEQRDILKALPEELRSEK